MLSAALIVKDEEPYLEGCLRSIAGLVDECIVVDTGSRDQSPQIARDLGARLYEFPWAGDFAAARNEALRHVRGDWVLYIDADERLREFSSEALSELLSDRDKIGYYVLLHARPGFTPYLELRLFRNNPLVRFQGVIHENIWPGLRKCRETRGGNIGESGLVLDHLGYEGDQSNKHERNLPLLLQSLECDPERVFNWCHLAGVYTGLGEVALAEKAWLAGVDVVRRKQPIRLADSFPYLGLIEHRMRAGEDVRGLLDEAADGFPGNMQLLWLEGRYLMKQQDYTAAAQVFERLIHHGLEQDFDPWVGYDQRLFDLFAYDSLATCYFRLRRYEDSARFYGLAAERDPSNKEYRVKQHLCARLNGS